MATKLALRRIADGTLVEAQDVIDNGDGGAVPGVAVWGLEGYSDLLSAASIYTVYTEAAGFEIVEVEVDIKVCGIFKNLAAAFEEDDEDEVIGHDQGGEPVTRHSTGHPACPAVHGGHCPIDGHNADDHDEPTGALEDLAKGNE